MSKTDNARSTTRPLTVRAFWDPEAGVWVATSDDVPGLITEAETRDKLVEKLKVLIPELLDANSYPDGDDEVPFRLLTVQDERTTRHRHAA
jgi:predicted RNase H-like HicB family nuclease